MMEKFDPAILADRPVVSLYSRCTTPSARRCRDIWDLDMFQGSDRRMPGARSQKPRDKMPKGIVERDTYSEHPDMPLWLHAGEGSGLPS